MTDKTLYCTTCETKVWVEVGHDGYSGQCNCDYYYFAVGSGDRPPTWERGDDLTTLSNFGIRDGDAVCAICDDGGDVTADFERAKIGKWAVKATVTCRADHWRSDRENEAVVYATERRATLEYGSEAAFWPDPAGLDTETDD